MSDTLTLDLQSPTNCLCDFTYNFSWQHEGAELEPDAPVEGQQGSEYTYRDLVEHLRSGSDVHIIGNAGSRLGSSLGVDLKYFGGSGKALDVGSIFVDGDVGTRMGISMVSGRIYISGSVAQPVGNVVEVVSDRDGYRCLRSITDILHNGMEADEFINNRNSFTDKDVPYLVLADGVLRDTVGARCERDVKVLVEGDVSLSTGILMQKGIVYVDGDAGMNTGTLLWGGMVVVRGSVGEFAGADMRAGNLIITGGSRGYMCANMRGGAVFTKREVKVIPPARQCQPTSDDLKLLVDVLDTNRMIAMGYRKYGIC
ncbi:MAG: formylmethanofuran dehydrogenase [ANME-2 cluster archaeon]|nr:formylmethanofuran dehydrogenase [ANME-2 cluster archaeon]